MDKNTVTMIKKRDITYRNAMFFEVILELVGIFADWMVLAEVAVVALATTMVLWQVFLAGDKKQERSVGR